MLRRTLFTSALLCAGFGATNALAFPFGPPPGPPPGLGIPHLGLGGPPPGLAGPHLGLVGPRPGLVGPPRGLAGLPRAGLGGPPARSGLNVFASRGPGGSRIGSAYSGARQFAHSGSGYGRGWSRSERWARYGLYGYAAAAYGYAASGNTGGSGGYAYDTEGYSYSSGGCSYAYGYAYGRYRCSDY